MLYFVFYVKKRMFHCRCKTRMRLDGLHLCVYSCVFILSSDGLQLCVYTFFRNFGPLEEAVTLT